MGRYLVIDTTTREIVNVVVWDGVAAWSPPAGTIAEDDAGRELGKGGTLTAGGAYTPPVIESEEI